MTILLLFLSLYIGINFRVTIVTSIIELVLLALLIFLKFKKRLLLVCGVVMLFGIGLSYIRFHHVKETYSGFVTEVKENYFIFSSSFENYYVQSKEHGYEIGDYLSITGNKVNTNFVTLESEFNFNEYLNNKGVFYQLEVTSIEVKFLTPFRINSVKKNFLNQFDGNTRGVIGSILLNYSSHDELVELSRDLHIARLISSSGVFLYFLYKVNKKLLSLFIKKEKLLNIFSLMLMTPYFIFTFPKFTVIKFFTLYLVKFVTNDLLKKKISHLALSSGVGVFFLLINPFYAYQDAFFLSFYVPIIALFIKNSFKFKKRITKWFISLLLIKVAFIPFTIKYYSELSILSFPLEIIFTPVYLFIFVLGLLSIIVSPISNAVNFLTNRLFYLLTGFQKINPKIYIHQMDGDISVIYIVIYLFLLYYASIRLRPLKNAFIAIIIGLVSSLSIPIKAIFKDYVCFINVGQGDSTLIRYKNKTILIDTGGSRYKDIATEVLIPFFKNEIIYKIDLLITTHDDFDHSGAVDSLIENFTVSNYIKDYSLFPINAYGLTLTNYNVYPDLWKEENDSSLVIGFNINNYNYLVMGDAPKKIENAIMKDNKYIPCDILKVGHHGSNTSTSEAFIKYLRPKVGIISCGVNNIYGHPHKEVIAILKKYSVAIRRTDEEGTITF